MRKKKLPQRGIEREAVGALSRRVYEHRARSVDDVPRRDLPPARLKHVLHFAAAPPRDFADDGKDRPDGHVDIDVRRAVERIEEKAVFPATKVGGDVDDPRLLL